MSDENTDTSTGAAGAGGAAQAAGSTSEPMVSAALLDAARGELAALQSRFEEIEGSLQTVTGERDAALQSNRRMSIRLASGIDDDEVADIAHSRYSKAVEGVDNDKRQTFSEWWKATAADDEARAALPLVLRSYATSGDNGAGQSSSQTGGTGGRRAGTPSTQGRRDPRPGGQSAMSAEDFARLDASEQARVAGDFWARGRRRVR